MDELKKIHELELMIAGNIKTICENNNINYFLIAGSLLGAVRHRGFIPWDDDIDIGMLRKDYDKFLECCKTQLDQRFFLQTWDTEADYPFSFAKIRLNGTKMVEDFCKNANINMGIFVDIFPFDNAPDDEKERRKRSRKQFLYRRILWIKKGMGDVMKSEGLRQKLRYYAFYSFSRFISYDKTKNKFKKFLTEYDNEKTNYIVSDGSYGYLKETINREWAEDLIDYKFENTSFKSFSSSDEYLSQFYGDYMSLPPESERNGHIRLNIDFGIYG